MPLLTAAWVVTSCAAQRNATAAKLPQFQKAAITSLSLAPHQLFFFFCFLLGVFGCPINGSPSIGCTKISRRNSHATNTAIFRNCVIRSLSQTHTLLPACPIDTQQNKYRNKYISRYTFFQIDDLPLLHCYTHTRTLCCWPSKIYSYNTTPGACNHYQV